MILYEVISFLSPYTHDVSFHGGCLGIMAKFGPLARSEACAGVSGLDDKLMTHLLLEPVDVSRLLLLEPVIVDVVVVAVVVMVAGGLVVVVVSPLLLLFCVCGRTTLVVSLSMDGGIYHWFGDYAGIHFF